MMERTYRICDVVNEEFLRFPLTLLANPQYKEMSLEAKFVYALLLNRLTLSQKNGWINDDGEVYLVYTREEASATLNISYKKAIAAFRELIENRLLVEQRQGRGYPNLLYVLKAELADRDAAEFLDSLDKPAEENAVEPYPMQNCQNSTSRTAETAVQDMPESHIQTCHTDSLEGIIKLLPSLSQASFLHIDPYEIDKKGISGTTYLDVLIQATQAGMKCLLWYGFMTGNNKIHINQYIVNRLEEENIKEYTCIELIMNSIRKDTIPCNPGILGSGILATNLSKEANKAIWDYSNMLVCMYSDTKYKSYDGRLYRDSIK